MMTPSQPPTSYPASPQPFDRYGDVSHATTTGLWECDLATECLTWSDGVYDLFGLPRGSALARPTIATLYTQPSRIALECKRLSAIRDKTGFVLDAEIRVGCKPRWIRIVAQVDCVGGKAMRLFGSKSDVTQEYAFWKASGRELALR